MKKNKIFISVFIIFLISNSFVANAIISLTEEEWFFSIPSSLPDLTQLLNTFIGVSNLNQF